MTRVTRKDLDAIVARINAMTGDPAHPYYISGAYGGWSLRRSVEGGGEVDPLHSGYVPVRQLYNLMHAYIRGYDEHADAVARQDAAHIYGADLGLPHILPEDFAV